MSRHAPLAKHRTIGYPGRQVASMALAQADLQQVIDYVKLNLHQILAEAAPELIAASAPLDRQLLDRMVRVEEELKDLRETMERRFQAQQEMIAVQFAAVEKRFQDWLRNIDGRFEGVNNRFEDMNRRFDDVNNRFEEMNRRFEEMNANVNRRFEEMNANVNKRIEEANANVNKRFEDANKRFALIQWVGIVGFAMLATITSVIGLIGLGG